MAWIAIALISILLITAMMYFGKIPRKTWEVTAAFMMLGLAGYALQGSPSLKSSPAKDLMQDSMAAEALLDMRATMVPELDGSRKYTVTADSFARNGNYPVAVSWTKNGIMKYPNDSQLWAALGMYLMLSADGQFLEPSIYAFEKAAELSPNNPVPDYFAGVSFLMEGQPVKTIESWSSSIKKGREDGKWKPKVKAQIEGLISAAQQMQAAQNTAKNQQSGAKDK